MSSFWFRIIPVTATLAVSAVSGTYYLVRLAHECAGVGFVSCVQKSLSQATAAPPTPPTMYEPAKKPTKSALVKPRPTAPPQPTPLPQDHAVEAMLISTGLLDGEVGRTSKSDFDKAVRTFQASVGRDGVGGELSASQRKALRGRFESARATWQLRKVPDAQGFELWLPARLLAESRRLRFGRRFEVDNGDFSVDVAQFLAPDWTLERLEDQHCCRHIADPQARGRSRSAWRGRCAASF